MEISSTLQPNDKKPGRVSLSNKTNVKLKAFKSQKTLFLFLVPGALALLAFSYLPMVGLLMAFQDYKVQDGFFGSSFVGLKHFAEFLGDSDFFNAFKNTLGISILSIVFGFPAPIILALMIDSVKNIYFKKITQTITYLPHFISWVIIASLVYRLLDKDGGVVNMFLELFGQERIAFMQNADYFWTILIITAIWKEIGWNSIIYLAAISGIDTELYSAAMVDGAGKFKRMLHITLPGIMPTVSLMLILNIGTLVSVNFDAVFNMMNPVIQPSAEVIDTYIYRTGIQMAKYSYATSVGFTQSVISILLVFTGMKIAKKVNGYSII